METAAELQRAAAPRELRHDELTFKVAPNLLGFATTDDVETNGDWFGQERALASLELGLQVRHAGFNIYVCGLGGTHRDELLAKLLQRFTADQPTPGDRVLVQNFHNPDRPRALYLTAGWGVRLRNDMRELVQELHRVLPETFRQETFEEEKERLSEQFGGKGEAISRQLDAQAAQAGFALQQAPSGDLMFIPLREGRPMKPEENEKLSDAERADLRRRQRELARQVKAVMREQQALMRQLGREVRLAERRVADEAIAPIFEELRERYVGADVRAWLEEAPVAS